MSAVRILHAVPNAPAVDVYANDELIVRNLPYRKFTEYLKIPAGPYNIKVFPAGRKDQAVYDSDLMVPENTIATIAASGLLPDIELLPFIEPKETIPPGKVCVRFAHLSPDAPAVDITLPDGTIIFEDVAYEEITDYECIDPGNYTIQARLAGTSEVVLTVPNIRLYPNRFHTIYAVGLAGDDPPLQVLIPLDGNTYIQL